MKRPKKPALPPAMLPQMWALEDIKPHPKNARTHPPEQVALLASMILKHGPDQPIVVDEAGVILKGHGRRLAAISAGLDAFPVVAHLGLSEQEKTAMRISDNQVALLAGWDRGLISGAIADLKASGYDIPLLGFPEAQLRGWGIGAGAGRGRMGRSRKTAFHGPDDAGAADILDAGADQSLGPFRQGFGQSHAAGIGNMGMLSFASWSEKATPKAAPHRGQPAGLELGHERNRTVDVFDQQVADRCRNLHCVPHVRKLSPGKTVTRRPKKSSGVSGYFSLKSPNRNKGIGK